ncbi:alanine and arginine-rich domain-containing protein [Antechinus flavipes]|uniref:alanine and arginine-rich domain-containing protein n=1 Tax=Antechinus flavipes TaxID=38775 RepID=UPI0022369C09|nr:alanine and arginine-rich domain-containing protein [Antechinus flavipes]
MSAEAHGEDAASSLVLEDVQRRLRNAFGSSISPRDVPLLPPEPRKQQQEQPQQPWESFRSRATAVREELRRAHIEGAISWLRAELLEMRFQNRQLARTFVDLNLEMQRLKIENELFMASECPTLGKSTVSPE